MFACPFLVPVSVIHRLSSRSGDWRESSQDLRDAFGPCYFRSSLQHMVLTQLHTHIWAVQMTLEWGQGPSCLLCQPPLGCRSKIVTLGRSSGNVISTHNRSSPTACHSSLTRLCRCPLKITLLSFRLVCGAWHLRYHKDRPLRRNIPD